MMKKKLYCLLSEKVLLHGRMAALTINPALTMFRTLCVVYTCNQHVTWRNIVYLARPLPLLRDAQFQLAIKFQSSFPHFTFLLSFSVTQREDS